MEVVPLYHSTVFRLLLFLFLVTGLSLSLFLTFTRFFRFCRCLRLSPSFAVSVSAFAFASSSPSFSVSLFDKFISCRNRRKGTFYTWELISPISVNYHHREFHFVDVQHLTLSLASEEAVAANCILLLLFISYHTKFTMIATWYKSCSTLC